MKIGIIGYKGFIGSAIFSELQLNSSLEVVGISRGVKPDIDFDIVVNANGNPYRWLANKEPRQDFDMSVVSVVDSLFELRYKKYIYISSVDVYADNIYGFHKSVSEQCIQRYASSYVLLRCSAVIGTGMRKGIIYDIINDEKLWLTPDSYLQFITNTEVAKIVTYITKHDIKNKIYNVGGLGPVRIGDLEEVTNKEFTYNEGAHRETYYYEPVELSKIYKLKESIDYVREVVRGS